MSYRHTGRAAYALCAMLTIWPGVAAAQSGDEFYKGKTISILLGADLGSAYGTHALAFKTFFAKHIPGQPNVVPVPMSGGGGAKMANYLFNAAPQDGTVIGFPLKYIAVDGVLGRPGLKYDARKFGYIGTLGPINSALIVWRATSPALTLEDMKSKEVLLGSTGRSAETYITPTLMNELLGTKLKVILGYGGMADIMLAMERGELHGRAASWEGAKSAKPQWIAENRIAVVAQSALERDPDLKDVPTLLDLARTKDERDVFEFFANGNAVGWMLISPPKMPMERLTVLRAAFDRAVKDPAYPAEAKARRVDVAPRSGAEVEALINRTMDARPELIVRIKRIMGLS